MSGIGAGIVGPFGLNTDWLVSQFIFDWVDIFDLIYLLFVLKVGDVFLKNVYFSTNEDNNKISIAKPLH